MTLEFNLPDDLKSALYRRHHGAKHTLQEIDNVYKILKTHYKKYNIYKTKLNYLLNTEWEEKRIENHFKEPIWYHAHRKLAQYEKLIMKQHKAMFKLLTEFDGNSNQEFSQFYVIKPDDIIYDFECKYLNIIDKI